MKYVLRWLIRALFNLVAHVELTGYEHLPKEGSFVIATNHLGIVDAPMAFYALDRWDMFVLVAEKWEKVALFCWLSKYFNLIFIDRYNPDVKTLRKVIKLMEANNILVIAPEGTRSRVGSLIEAKPGVSYLAAKLNRPIVPVALTGTEDKVLLANLKRLKRTRITVTAGPAFTLPPLPKENRDEALKQYTDEIMCRIAALLPEKYRGFYAEHPRLKELLEKQERTKHVKE
ncbi:MAG: lysophospholipid acyltransferase family protein [Chloroflexota bacterium]|nr:1-acyl-sn-glycerol-3-phosphate acyltransferase [Chloroflexota bacterium]MBI5702260.1 1-acyl-sn-glycerol-3-phosphate acyltransferase [Chloroflexota bacterium]